VSETKAAKGRFIVVDGSQSGHCCFQVTVVDTTKPVMIGGKHYNGEFEPMCECFDSEIAEAIAAALNAAEERNAP
jgi:hypothetical protein